MKLKKMFAVVVDDKGNESQVLISDLVKLLPTVNINKITQPGNPMALTPSMIGYQITMSLSEPVEEF